MTLSRPHPSGKGRGGCGSCGSILACEGAAMAWMEPTSLNGGEGLAGGLVREVGVVEDGGGGGRRREDERISTMMGLMFDSNSARPHR